MTGKMDWMHLLATGEVRTDTGGMPDPEDCDFMRTEINILDNQIANIEAYVKLHPYDHAAQIELDRLKNERAFLAQRCGHTSEYGEH